MDVIILVYFLFYMVDILRGMENLDVWGVLSEIYENNFLIFFPTHYNVG